MNTRANVHTTIAPYEVREAAWKAALEAAEKHVKLGMTLQGQGVEILQSKQAGDPEGAAKLIQQATATIEKGVKIERDARDKLIDLYQQQPRIR